MDFAQITQLIGSYGFPIVCCIYMMYHNNKTAKENQDNTATAIEKLTESLTENTVETQKAVTQLGNLISEFNTFLSILIKKGDVNNG